MGDDGSAVVETASGSHKWLYIGLGVLTVVGLVVGIVVTVVLAKKREAELLQQGLMAAAASSLANTKPPQLASGGDVGAAPVPVVVSSGPVPTTWSPAYNAIRGRYVRVTFGGVNGGAHYGLNSIQSFFGTKRYDPVNGRIDPPGSASNDPLEWQVLREDDANDAVTGFTNHGAFGTLEIDLGSEQPIDRVLVVNRKGCCQFNIVNMPLTIHDTQKTEVFRYTFKDMKASYDLKVFQPPVAA